MKKIAWPWIGTTEHEMASVAPKGEVTDREQNSQVGPDSFVPEKSVLDDQPSVINYESGIMSPVEDVSLADDVDVDEEKVPNPIRANKDYSKANVEVFDEDEILANFSCDIASDFQDKVAGLQPYENLNQSAGLVFEYRRPEDVIYHMGAVKFPIDIIFINGDNKVKKIYKDIQPGTLGTFGCANVKNVLEICGGLSDRLGISIGNSIKLNKGSDSNSAGISNLNKQSSRFGLHKDIIVKYSSIGRDGFSNWKNFPIYTITDDLDKVASESTPLSDLISSFTQVTNKKIYAFDFDGLIEESPTVRVYKTSEVVEDEVPFIRIDGHTVSIDRTEDGNEIYRDVHLYELDPYKLGSNESIISSLNKSYSEFLNSPKIIEEAFKIFDEVRTAAKDSDGRMIIVTRSPNPEYLRDVVCNRIGIQLGESIEAEVLKIGTDADATDIIHSLKSKYGNRDIKIFSDPSLLVRAGSPIPDDVKQSAKSIYKLLDAAAISAEKSLENMQRNLAEYEKIKADTEAISKSKSQYHRSVRSNTRFVKEYLIKIRDAIRMFNTIKDISTTQLIMDSLTSSAKIASDGVESIFDLVDKIDSPDFYMILKEEVTSYERIIEDLHASIDKGKNYINKDILGLIVLSE